jgi:NitT/TauT family transport system permease protein
LVKRTPGWLDFEGPRVSWPGLAIVVVFLSAWEVAARAGMLSPLFFPAPSVAVRAGQRLVENGELWEHLRGTFGRALSGLLAGGTVGYVLGLGMGWSHRIRAVFDPLIAVLHPVPKIAYLPLALLLLGVGETSNVLVVGISAFFPMVINSMAGVVGIPRISFEVAQTFGASHWREFWRIVVPGSLPFVLAGARVAINASLLVTVGLELAYMRRGLGALLWRSWQTLRPEELYLTVAILSAIGLSLTSALRLATRSLVPWYGKD